MRRSAAIAVPHGRGIAGIPIHVLMGTSVPTLWPPVPSLREEPATRYVARARAADGVAGPSPAARGLRRDRRDRARCPRGPGRRGAASARADALRRGPEWPSRGRGWLWPPRPWRTTPTHRAAPRVPP